MTLTEAPKENGIYVARTKAGAYVQIHGYGNLHNAPAFEAFALSVIKNKLYDFVLNLEFCRGVDSTFMGTLLNVDRTARESNNNEAGGLVLLNTSKNCNTQISSVGLDQFLQFRESTNPLPPVQMVRLDESLIDQKEGLDLIVRVHQQLIAADPRNEEKFGPFLRSILNG